MEQGLARLEITYADGREQLAHIYVVGAAPAHVANYAEWMVTRQYYTNKADPFHRAPSFLNYDRRTNHVIEQNNLAWIPGLSDECGAGEPIEKLLEMFTSAMLSQ
jgi:hypothetical protein